MFKSPSWFKKKKKKVKLSSSAKTLQSVKQHCITFNCVKIKDL